MNVAAPAAFALAALAIPIVVFYVLKVRLRRVPISTNLFWKQLYDEKPPRSIWQYLRHILSLLAQLFFVLLLILAVADPSFSWQLLKARRIVCVVDNSASMRALDIAPSRFDAAIEAAVRTAEGLRFRDEMAIILAGPEPQVVVGMSGHVPTLKQALRSIEVSDNPTQLDTAIELGQQLLGDHPHGQVIVFTDGCAEVASTAAANIDVQTFAEADTANVGITQFQVRRSLIDPLGYEVLLAVRNASGRSVNGRLELELDGLPVDVLPLTLEAEEVFNRSLEKTSLEGGTLTARLIDFASADEATDSEAAIAVNALLTDDLAWAVLPPREPQDVLIVTPGNLFLQKVFEANPLVRVTTRKDFPDAWPANTIIVLHQTIPTQLPSGDIFLVDPQNDCNAFTLGEMLANPIITEQDTDSSLMTHVRLDNVLMPQARQLRFTDTPHVLAGAVAGDPVYAELKHSGGKGLVLSVDINEGDLAFRTAFPIMVTNALGWFANQSGELRPSLAAGSATEIALPNVGQIHESRNKPAPLRHGAADIKLQSPSGETQPLVARSRDATQDSHKELTVFLPALDECGIWRIQTGDSSEDSVVELAVNLSNDDETNLRPRTITNAVSSKPLVASWFTRPLWFYFAFAACVLTTTEWWLYQRRIIT